MKKIDFVNGTTIDGAKTFNDIQNNVEDVFNGKEPMGNILVDNIKCKNKFDVNSLISTDSAYFTINSSTKFTVTSTGTAYESGYVYVIVDVEPNTNCTISGSNTSSIEIWSEDIKEYINSTGGLPFTFNVGNHERIAILFRATNAQVTSEFENIQVEKGSTATEYTPYKKFGYNENESMGKIVVDDISCKNLFNKNDITIGQLNITDGTINSGITLYRTSNYIDVISGQTLFVSTADWFQVCYYDTNKVFISSEEYQLIEGHSTTVPINAKYMRISTGVNSVDTTQIEKGDKATSYTPYKNFESRTDIITGQECPTNEYIDGKQVFLYRANLGQLPDNSQVHFYTGLDSSYNLVRYNLMASQTTQRLNIPHSSLNNEYTINGYCDNVSTIPIKTVGNFTAYSLIVEIYYTKL